jgi:monoterpene epsilon-lactone hydrolase
LAPSEQTDLVHAKEYQMYLLTGLVIIVLIFWSLERFYIRGAREPEHPTPADPHSVSRFSNLQSSGSAQETVTRAVKDITAQIAQSVKKGQMPAARASIDNMSDGRDYVSKFSAVDAGGIPAEWVVAPGADPNRRVLYIHGGGFIMGSPKSHRTITSKFSEITGCAVLAIDYRLLPEHKLMDCVEDCRTAFRWLLKNGPDGPADLQQLFLGGDSAGGNLALSLTAWVRDNRLRLPDAVIALSPLTDCTFSGASIRQNQTTDVMLEPIMRPLNKLPQFVKSWWVVWTHGVRPANPAASPLLGNLSGLPPILIQASEAEMLLDDARRYVYKACAAGSPVKLQTWPDMVHVWQIFDPELPQAAEAWNEIGSFLGARTHA